MSLEQQLKDDDKSVVSHYCIQNGLSVIDGLRAYHSFLASLQYKNAPVITKKVKSYEYLKEVYR